MRSFLVLAIIAISYAIHECDASAEAIVTAAASQKGVPYSWGGGGYRGKSKGIDSGAHTVGFDCSGLAQYAVYHGTGKIISRTAASQQNDAHCTQVAYTARKAGDLVFFGNPAHHVGIVSNNINDMWEAPHTGDVVKQALIYSSERQAHVRRCA